MTIGLCDDETAELAALRHFVEDYGRDGHLPFDIFCFSNGEAILAAIGEGQNFDIIFLDIYMGGADGISVAREIRKRDAKCAIVFETSSSERAIEGYGVRALQYLLKPLTANAVNEALREALENLQPRKDERFIQIKNKQGNYRIALGDILYAESDARIINVHLKDENPVAYYDKLDNFQKLCGDERFVRCHKSYLVNLDHVHAIINNEIIMKSGETIHISMNVSPLKAAFAVRMADRL
jgi:DNA-binding LytR/AlgR family response regulator